MTKKTSKLIESITLKYMIDDSPDTSFLGEYSNNAKGDYSIDRKHTLDCAINSQDQDADCTCDGFGNMKRNEYRYFNTSGNYKGLPIEDIRKYTIQDYERMESANNGDWSFIGIRSEAWIVVNGVMQEITSGGLWGIESDSDKSYLESVEQEELSELRSQLYTLGFSKRAIAVAMKDVKRKEF